MSTFTTKSYAVMKSGEALESWKECPRRSLGPNDIHIAIKFAGICHTDIHKAREEWGPASAFPMVPGHEIGGEVKAIGSSVTKFKLGDRVGVGCFVDSCRNCQNCKSGDDHYCSSGPVLTYDGTHKYEHCGSDYNENGGNITYGGYSQDIVVDENYVCRIPDNLDLASATPLLCAGITMYSPMVAYNLRPNMKFAVAGLGGLGHMGVKLARAWGCDVTVISRGTKKKDDALKLGAHHFLDSTNEDEMKAHANTFDFIIDTIAANHDIGIYLALVKTRGRIVVVGAPAEPFSVNAFGLIPQARSISGSMIGGIRETQEMLDFCGRHNIVCDIEMIKACDINDAYERTIAADVKYRFVIDTATM